LCYFWVLEEELPGGMTLAAKRRMPATQFSGFLFEWPGGDEHLLGDASKCGSILGLSGFWVIFLSVERVS